MPTLDRTGAWLYFHAPKTGGTYVSATMEAAGGVTTLERHASWHAWPGARYFGTVRNPWSWYVSRFLWQYPHDVSPVTFREQLRRWTAADGWGYCTTEHRYVYRDKLHAYIPTDRIDEGLPALLGYSLQRTAWRNPSHERCGVRVDYRSWYTPELEQWVADADADHIDRYGFRPWERSPEAVYLAGASLAL